MSSLPLIEPLIMQVEIFFFSTESFASTTNKFDSTLPSNQQKFWI